MASHEKVASKSVTAENSAILKIPYAVSNGRLVHISEVASGLSRECVCLECHAPLIARKGQKVRHHFAHYRPTKCQPETVVHRIAKRLMAERIETALAGHEELPIQWVCAHCDDTHAGNLLKRANSIHVERGFGSCRPDLTVCGRSGKPTAFIEIVVTHPPDESVRNICRLQAIELSEYHVTTDEDLERIADSSPLVITRGSYCPSLRCSKCQKRLGYEKLHLVAGQCPRCKRDMKIAFASSGRLVRGPDEFSTQEVEAARRHGGVLERRHSNTLNAEYIANVCPRCHAFIGKHFMDEYMNWKADAVCWSDCSHYDDESSRATQDKRQLSLLNFFES